MGAKRNPRCAVVRRGGDARRLRPALAPVAALAPDSERTLHERPHGMSLRGSTARVAAPWHECRGSHGAFLLACGRPLPEGFDRWTCHVDMEGRDANDPWPPADRPSDAC